jgi:hypothetical protein
MRDALPEPGTRQGCRALAVNAIGNFVFGAFGSVRHVGGGQISRRFGDFRRDSVNNRTGNCWRGNREIIFGNREFRSIPEMDNLSEIITSGCALIE